ncbi:MAG: BRCT domain-containing protein [Candidatus Hermodarchaeota archaeon]
MADLSLIKFYFSSDLKTMGKEEAKKKVIEKGGIVREEITTDLWYLVTNNIKQNAKKYEKALKLGITFIDEKEFLEMIE